MNTLLEKLSGLSPEKRARLAERLPPLSFAQQRLWFLDQLEPGSVLYNVPTSVRLTGELDIDALSLTLDEIVRRHESLRTVFVSIEEEPRQLILPPEKNVLVVVDLRDLDPAARKEELDRRIDEEAHRPFDLRTGPLLRVRLLCVGESEYVLCLTMHHIICDRWSMGILIGEMLTLYHAFAAAKPSPLPELTIQYADYARWQREWLSGEVLANQIAYWREKLGGTLPLLELATDRQRPSVQTFRGTRLPISIPEDLIGKLRDLGQKHGCTLYMTVLAAFQTLLYRYTDQEDIIVGTPVSGRSRSETENLIGFFVNTLAMRTDLSGAPTCAEVLNRVREVALGAYAHQELPFEKLVEELQPQRDLSRSPLFQVMFVLQNTPAHTGSSLDATKLKVSRLADELETSKFDLTLTLADSAHSLSGVIEYNVDLFAEETIKRMAGHFQTLLKGMVETPEQQIGALPLLSEHERQQLLVEWNDTATEYPRDSCLHELFEAQAERTPDALAVVFGDQRLTYTELNERANQLAHHLRSLGVTKETRVGLYVERSQLLLVGLLGIFKAGGVYVPLDPEYPAERLKHMLTDAGVNILLTDRQLQTRLPLEVFKRVAIDEELDWDLPKTNPERLARAENAAYVIYTSGSTGMPKGVVCEHGNLVNVLTASVRSFGITGADRLPALASAAFDISLFELLTPLLAGGVVEVCGRDQILEMKQLVQVVRRSTLLHTVPSLMRQLLQALEDERRDAVRLRQLFIGGDSVAPALLEQMREEFGEAEIRVLYGPTEATLFCTSHLVNGRERGRQQIGRPLANVRARVCDSRGELTPVGVVGELYIGGAGVTRGYLGRDEDTNRVYVELDGERFYRTGDLVKWGSDGELEYVGRRDSQVKVRGYRIELGEIESVLLRHEGVSAAVVVAREDGSEKRLVGYVVPEADELSVSALREYLAERLPSYMVPGALVQLAELPLTPNGKVDRKALALREDVGERAAESVLPRTAVEELLASIWAGVLRLEGVGVEENFFELGGHSLLATQVMSRVREVFGVEVPLRSLFEQPTVAGLAGKIEAALRGERGVAAPPLERVSRERALPLSFAQQRLWFLDQLEPGSAFYNVPTAVRLQGQLNIEALERTLTEIVRRHEVLRTTFQSINGEAVQVIGEAQRFAVAVTELSALEDAEREQRAQELIDAEAQTPFDLSAGPLLRLKLLRLAAEEHIVALTMHHIVSDGWSMGLLLNEIATLYRAYSTGEASPLMELSIQYADYAVWQREWLQGEVLETELGYWREQLGEELPVLELPTDRPRLEVQSFRGAVQFFQLGEQSTHSLRKLGQDHGCTLFMTMLAAFQILLYRYSGQEEIVVGSPIAGRNRMELEKLIGFFVNTLVLRTKLSGKPNFVELLKRVREVALGAYAHQEVPFEKLVEEMEPERDLSRSPLFQVMFILQNAAGRAEQSLPAAGLQRVSTEARSSKFDLTMSVTQRGDVLEGVLEYNTDLFEVETMVRLLEHYQNLLQAIAANPQDEIAALSLLGESERRQLLEEWNDTAGEYSGESCLHELFEAQVERTPAAVAVVYGEQQLTYAELNSHANQLARHLRSLGVGPDVLVGICVERSVEMVVGLLGILKAGGAYVPLDPSYPAGRLAYLLEDAKVRVLLTQAHLCERLPQMAEAVVCVDEEWPEIARHESGNLSSRVLAESLAYVIYTSGSTGGPKGVCVTHANAVHSTSARMAYYEEVVKSFLLLSSFAFDSSVAGLFWTLSQGGTLVLLEEGAQQDVREVRRAVAAQGVTHLLSLGSLYQVLLADESGASLDSLQTVIVAGEACRAELVERHHAVMPGAVLYNEYGPTEASVWSTVHDCVGGEEPVPIGRPIRNMQAYVLDEQQRLAPRGVRGELYLGGAGVARGYLGRAELTAERFVPHPFSAEAGARLYRTGDIGWYRADGALMYGGRVDEQVKLRGYRIELGEIEAALLGHEGVREAVVVAREERLVGYVVGDELSTASLREYLSERLPSYMVPGALVQLTELPLTPNGKVDRKALALREDVGERAAESVLPRTAVEELLASIWAGVLRLEGVGIAENFFELGGHSLLATQVMSRVREVFGVEVPLRSLFEQPTVAGLAGKIEAALRGERGIAAPPLERVSRERALPLSFAQQRLWFLDQLEPGSAFYNVPTAVRLQGQLNVEALERTLSEIVRRHEVLRTTFKSIDGQPVQVIGDAEPLRIAVTELSVLEEGEREETARRLIDAEAQTPFDLSTGPLLRVKLLRLGAEEHIVLLTMHHIVSDGWSMGLLLNEVATLYRAYSAGEASPLMELPIQYADYAVWQREWLQGEVLEAELGYWRAQLGGDLPVLQLPTDRPRPAVQSFRGARVPFRLQESLVEKVKAVSAHHDCTLFMTLLATLQTLLYRYSGQKEIIVGSPVAGRSRPELEPLIGMFLNQIVLRTDLSGDPAFSDLLRRVREVALDAYAHQDVPFEKLVEELQPERDLSRSPLFQVDLTFQQISAPASDARANLQMIPMNSEARTSKFDLTLSLAEIGDAVFGTLEYNTDLFDGVTIELMTEHFQNLLGSIAEHPEEKLSRVQLLSLTERQQLLVEWNDTTTEYPRESCIHELFEAQVERTPEAVAVVFGNHRLTYAELNERANQLAHHLRSLGVAAETLVGLCVERSLEMVVGLLGILKAGGAYVSLDPEYPAERLNFMLEDAGISVLLTQQHLLELLPSHWALTFCLDSEWPELAGTPTTNPSGVAVQPENLAYVSYTSGSTGRPKGVSIPHRAVVSLLCPAEFVRLDERETVLQMSPLPFDASTFEVWGSLLNGARLVLMPPGQATLEEIGAVLREQQVTTLWLTAGLFHLMVDEQLEALVQVKQLLAGGDVLSVEHSRRYLAAAGAGSVLVNGYGPTESTTFTSCEVLREAAELAEATSVAIGKVVGGRRAYVVDESGELVGRGIWGELYIGGAGVGRGYVQRAEETAERFVPDGWSGEWGGRVYRTGDVVRWKGEGKLEFKGRADGQVKLRGYRIEVGEIEAVLESHGGVRRAVVEARADESGEKRLVGYVVLAEETGVDELRDYLAQRLPSYMVPRVLVPLDTLPLTNNGKVDRAALPAPSLNKELSDTSDQPQTAIEEMLAGVWSEVLKVERVGRYDNFFDLGGHSLLATQVFSRIREVFAVEISLRSLFENPTIVELAVVMEIALRSAEGVEAPPIKRRPEGERIPLSYAQQRLWFLDKLEPGSAFYNVPLAVRLRGQLNIDALARTLNEIVRRHEVLRTSFRSDEGEPEQIIHEALELKLELEQVSGEQDQLAEVRRLIKEESGRGFDLTHGPLLRVRLLRLTADEHVVLLTMHHIVSDGWSMGVLTKEIATLYRAFSAGEEAALPELPIQYADYAVWQREWLQGDVLARELEYWRKSLGGQLPTLNLPTDRPRPAVPTYRGAYRSFTLPSDLSEKVKQLGRDQGCTLFMTLMATFKTLLFRYSGQDDIIAGTIVANRNSAEIEPLIGLFINTLAIRTDLSGDPTFKELMARVKENMLSAHVHQDVPFEKLVSELQTERELSRAPLFQVTFGVQNAPGGTLELPGLSLQMLNSDEGAVRYDLTHWVYETPGGLVFSWSYSTDLFDLSTIIRMQENFATLLKSIVDNPEAQLSTLEFLSEAEKRQQHEKEQARTKAIYRKFMDVKPKALRLTHDREPEGAPSEV